MQVQTLDLSNNRLTGSLLQNLSHYLPRLVNLSLQNNKLRLKDIEVFSNTRKGKFLNLKELILLGNPVRETELQEIKYRQYVSTAPYT